MTSQTAKQLAVANRTALKEGLLAPYSKEQHAVAQGCDLDDKRFWKFFLNTMEAYTKQEYAATKGCDALAVILWNRLLRVEAGFRRWWSGR